MIMLTTTEVFNTNSGKMCIVHLDDNNVKIGDTVSINGKEETIKNIIFPTRPQYDDRITLCV